MKGKKCPFTGGNPTRKDSYQDLSQSHVLAPFSPLVQHSLLNLAEPICVLCVGCSLLKILLCLEQQRLSCCVAQCPDFQVIQAVFDQDRHGHPTATVKMK